MPSIRTWLALLATASLPCATHAATTALDRYVAAPDPSYAWRIHSIVTNVGTRSFIVDLTSQTWLTTNEVDRPLWNHWLTVILPKEVKHPTALLFIGGGSSGKPAPTDADARLARVANATRSVVAELRNVPNQPLRFVGDGLPRTEDALIAYTWDKFLRTGDERWPARLPMTKSAVRALDTIAAVCATPEAGNLKVDSFVVAGGSKRGWTTWTTAAVDRRVIGIVPIVIDVLNMQPSFIHHFECYGFFAPAVDDYSAMKIMDWWGTPEMKKLCAIEEPFEYRDRFTLPKFILNATGDQFFVPDSSQFYFDQLPGPKFLRYVPNGDHSLKDTDAFETLASCYHAILNRTTLPAFTWTNAPDGSIRVQAQTKPEAVKVWQVTNPKARDFRLETTGPTWTARDLAPGADGSYVARVAKPDAGWTAYTVELTFANPGAPAPFKFTTNVRVTPDAPPFTYQPPARHPLAKP